MKDFNLCSLSVATTISRPFIYCELRIINDWPHYQASLSPPGTHKALVLAVFEAQASTCSIIVGAAVIYVLLARAGRLAAHCDMHGCKVPAAAAAHFEAQGGAGKPYAQL